MLSSGKFDQYKVSHLEDLSTDTILYKFERKNRKAVVDIISSGFFELYSYSHYVNNKSKVFEPPFYKIWIPLIKLKNKYKCLKIDTTGVSIADISLDKKWAAGGISKTTPDYYPIREVQRHELCASARDTLGKIIAAMKGVEND